MNGLEIFNSVLLVVHILSVVGLLLLLLLQINKSPRTIHPGALHTALTALVAGLVMVGIRAPLHNQDGVKYPEFNHAWVGAKFVILLVIIGLVSKNSKKESVSSAVWASALGLTVVNVLIAVL